MSSDSPTCSSLYKAPITPTYFTYSLGRLRDSLHVPSHVHAASSYSVFQIASHPRVPHSSDIFSSDKQKSPSL